MLAIRRDQFVYEYIGEVVSQPAFLKRMQDYADEGIQHFYFMMLQKEEYIDATKKGGIARFANHSCNPNCYVAKWVVGKRMRMGIFAKRNIQQGEELTFNYNVDRYGCGLAGWRTGMPLMDKEAQTHRPNLLLRRAELRWHDRWQDADGPERDGRSLYRR